jgi:hypothetical protein
MRRLLIGIGQAALIVFALIGFIVTCIVVVTYLSWAQPVPQYEGTIYDCQKVNWEALTIVSGLMIKNNYLPEVKIHRYPEDDGQVVLSLISPDNKLHLIFRSTVISTKDVPGKAPKPTVSSSLIAQH